MVDRGVFTNSGTLRGAAFKLACWLPSVKSGLKDPEVRISLPPDLPQAGLPQTQVLTLLLNPPFPGV